MQPQPRSFAEEYLLRLDERLKQPGPVSRRRIAREFGWSEKQVLAALHELARQWLMERLTEKVFGGEELIRETARVFRRCYSQELGKQLIVSLVREGVLARLPPKRLLYRPDAPEPLLEALDIKREGPIRPVVLEGLAERILAKIAELEEAPFVPVIVDRLRPAFPGLRKEEFDHAVLQLAGHRRVYLVPARVFPPEDREMLIHDGKGNYYGSLGRRR